MGFIGFIRFIGLIGFFGLVLESLKPEALNPKAPQAL